jgi:Dipeptide/tripeptide permease
MVLLGLGTGGIKATVSPFIGDQYTVLTPQFVVTNKGERVIADRTLTLQYIYNVFYWYRAPRCKHIEPADIERFTNIGSLSLIASTYLEREVGFWAAYLLPLCFVWVPIPLLLFWQRSFGKSRGLALFHSIYTILEVLKTRQSTSRQMGMCCPRQGKFLYTPPENDSDSTQQSPDSKPRNMVEQFHGIICLSWR